MTDHGRELIGPDEPEGGWVSSPQLFDGAIEMLIMCRYTATRLGLGEPCPMAARHPAGLCASVYLQAEAITSGGVLDQERFEEATEVIRRSRMGAEATASLLGPT